MFQFSLSTALSAGLSVTFVPPLPISLSRVLSSGYLCQCFLQMFQPPKPLEGTSNPTNPRATELMQGPTRSSL